MSRAISIYGCQIKPADQYTDTLPALGGLPFKIDCSNDMLNAVSTDIKVDFYWCMAENITQATALLGAVGTRYGMKAGHYEFSISNVIGDLYFMSQAGAEVAGISYTYGYLV
jgi:hypothetical protein